MSIIAKTNEIDYTHVLSRRLDALEAAQQRNSDLLAKISEQLDKVDVMVPVFLDKQEKVITCLKNDGLDPDECTLCKGIRIAIQYMRTTTKLMSLLREEGAN